MGESKVAEAQPATSYHEDIFGDPNIVMDKDQMLQLLDSPDSNSPYPNTSENLKVCMKRFCPWFVCCWYCWWVSQQAINDVCRLHVVHTFNQTPDFWLILLAYNSHTGLQRLFSHSVALDFRGYIDAMTERCRLFDTKYFFYLYFCSKYSFFMHFGHFCRYSTRVLGPTMWKPLRTCSYCSDSVFIQ